MPYWLAWLYLGSMLVLSVLNVRWFGRMVQTVRARFEGGKEGAEGGRRKKGAKDEKGR